MTARRSTPGDLGRRITYHRERLGLSPGQLAELAGMDPGFVEYVERNPSQVSEGTLLRLAAALQTSPDALLGGGMDRPLGERAYAAAKPRLEKLDEQECLRLIAPGGIGRIAFGGLRGPTVLPVNYRLHDGAIVFRTQEGGPMDDDLRTGLKGLEFKVGFEVDRIDEAAHTGWSVLIQGAAHHVTEEELPAMVDSGVAPWAGGVRRLYIRIVPQQITGRRIHSL
ncbi:pyridoxamine 5'-phosphate oxidase family protein [Nonomuraea sp. NPDC046570]|uniref:helix-turn-helix domain-containing protein n=1 Tax=Nonomuraea sp. NPDC046570 TaxID=3155255 RepID=UPI0033E4AC77